MTATVDLLREGRIRNLRAASRTVRIAAATSISTTAEAMTDHRNRDLLRCAATGRCGDVARAGAHASRGAVAQETGYARCARSKDTTSPDSNATILIHPGRPEEPMAMGY